MNSISHRGAYHCHLKLSNYRLKSRGLLRFPSIAYVWLSLSLSVRFLAMLYFFSDSDENVSGLLPSEDMYV